MEDEQKVQGRLHGEQFEPEKPDNIVMRILFLILIGFMMSVGQTILGAITIIQLVIMIVNRGEPNENLAEVGTDLGIWMAKSARYMSAASDVKPWPWTELD